MPQSVLAEEGFIVFALIYYVKDSTLRYSAESPKKILMVYPKTPQDSYWSFSNALKLIGKKTSMPPLGLLTVAAMLPDDEFDIRLIDENIAPFTDDDVKWADIVFVSAMIVQKERLEQIISRVKELGGTIVAGGPYTSTAYKETENVDCFFIGEAEGAWPVFLDDLRAGTLKKAYAAPVRDTEYEAIKKFFGDDAYIAQSCEYPDINLAPVPRFDLLTINDYAVMTVQASRGCPIGCEFCDIWRRFGRTSRNKKPDHIRAELDALYTLGWRDSVFLVDDNFIGNKARAREIMHELVDFQKKHGWPFTFLTETTLSLADDDELLGLMSEAGFNQVFVGIETPYEDSLKETRKYINTLGSIADKVAKIQSAGIQLMSGFIIGFDSDPDDIADRMTACIQEMGIPQAMIGILNALPETDLYDRLEKEGRILSETTGNNTHGFSINFEPARPKEAVLHDYKQVLESAYPKNMKSFFQRCEVLRDRWPRKIVSAGKLSLRWKLNAFVNCLWVVGKSSYRWVAYKFLIESLVKKPSFFENAITLCVKGHHFWIITGQAFEAEEMRELMHDRLSEFTDFLRSKHTSLGDALQALRQAIPDYKAVGDSVPDILGMIRSSLSGIGDRKDLQNCYARLAGTFKEIEAFRQRIQHDTKKQFEHLSRETRKMLESEFEKFCNEANILDREFWIQERLIPVTASDQKKW